MIYFLFFIYPTNGLYLFVVLYIKSYIAKVLVCADACVYVCARMSLE